MNINKISVPTRVKALAMGTLLLGGVVMCNNERDKYVDTLKSNVKENVEPKVYQAYEKKAAQFGVNKEEVFQKANDSVQFANRNYFEGLQNVRHFE